ncbi:MAG: hybrid sensor histidine kinase/response regulator, partial [Thermodesulfobacteriota bacterium]
MAPSSEELRVLVLPLTPKDGQIIARVLARSGIETHLCAGLDELCRHLAGGAGAALLPEETLPPAGAARLGAVLAGQPPWSDLPLLVLSRERQASPAALQPVERLGNVTLVERPVG